MVPCKKLISVSARASLPVTISVSSFLDDLDDCVNVLLKFVSFRNNGSLLLVVDYQNTINVLEGNQVKF